MRKIFLPTIMCILVLVFVAHAYAQTKSVNIPKRLLAIYSHHFKSVCDNLGQYTARCNAKVVTQSDGVTPLAGATPFTSSLGPVQLHTAYQLPCQPGGSFQTNCNTPTSFGPQTIAIVDAYYTPTIENDLNVYSNYFQIPPCTKENGCLTIVNQNGGSNLPSVVNSGWSLEASLDVQVAHAMCQTCKLLVLEANSSSLSNLATAVETAANAGVSAISNSYGALEWSGEKNYDMYYNHPGIAITAASGDNGYNAEWPASSQYVVGVGGTTLQLFTDFSYASESAWSGTGSGCSSYETANLWQINLSNWSQTFCGIRRAVSDISADADPNTGAAVYDTTAYNGQTGWWQVGGTSLSTPIIASTFTLAGGVPTNVQAGSILYYNSENQFHDITSGSNGTCGTIMCNSSLGYDGPTGLGTPNNIFGFEVNSVSLSPTPTPTPTATPTQSEPTVTPTATLTPTPSPTPTPITTQVLKVNIINPINGAIVRRNSKVIIDASVKDNIKVTKVQFFVNNNLLTTLTTSPYLTSWIVPSTQNVKYALTAKAYDAASYSSTSNITVTSN